MIIYISKLQVGPGFKIPLMIGLLAHMRGSTSLCSGSLLISGTHKTVGAYGHCLFRLDENLEAIEAIRTKGLEHSGPLFCKIDGSPLTQIGAIIKLAA